MTSGDSPQHTALCSMTRRPSGLPERQVHPSPWRCELCGDPIDEDRRCMERGTEHCTDCTRALSQLGIRGYR